MIRTNRASARQGCCSAMVRKKLSAIALVTLFTGVAGPVARAEPVLDRALSDVALVSRKSCSIISIGFNFRIRYVSHFPANRGRELRIRLQPLDRGVALAQIFAKREALRAPIDERAAIRAIEFEVRQAEGPILSIQFKRPRSYKVAQGSDFQSIIIAISGRKPSKNCKAVFPRRTIGGVWSTTVTPAKNRAGKIARLPKNRRRHGRISKKDLWTAGASMDEARAALKKKKNKEAIRLLNKVMSFPENKYTPEAQELLGLARQRNGQLALARAEYADYLRRYSNSEDVERIGQRLQAITPQDSAASSTPKTWKSKRQDKRFVEKGSSWSLSASASQFYIRDDSLRKFKDPSLPPDFRRNDSDHRIYQNSLLSSLDVTADWSNAAMKNKFRFSGAEEHDFLNTTSQEDFGVSALYLDTLIRSFDLDLRIGRQTRNTGGVLGRFDGGVISWQAAPKARLNLVAGSPVTSRHDGPFEHDTYFYGTSLDFGPFYQGLDTSIFAIEQRTEGYVDRRAIGLEARYFDANKSLFLTTDYDIYYNELNTFLFNGTWTLPDKSVFTAAFDYRTSPYLLTYNALQGQSAASLDELHHSYTRQQIEQLALDRTAVAKSATVGYSRPLNSKLQVSADVTIANISGTVASGNVAAIASTGNEYYYGAQLIANDLLVSGDITIFGLRYANRQTSDAFVFDLNTRYTLSPDFRINPRLRLSYQTSDFNDMREFAVLPSVVLNYYLTKKLSLELEVGGKFSDREQGLTTDQENEFFFTLGYRYDFYADGQRK